MPQATEKVTALHVPGQIVRGVPLSKQRGGGRNMTDLGRALRALAAAEIGDSVFVPAGWVREPAKNRLGAYLVAAAGPGCLSWRTVEGGYRVWKIGEPKKGGR